MSDYYYKKFMLIESARVVYWNVISHNYFKRNRMHINFIIKYFRYKFNVDKLPLCSVMCVHPSTRTIVYNIMIPLSLMWTSKLALFRRFISKNTPRLVVLRSSIEQSLQTTLSKHRLMTVHTYIQYITDK